MTERQTLLATVTLALLTCAQVARTDGVVTTVEFGEVAYYPSRDAPAETVSLNDARISAEITGVLRELPVSVGDRVRAGSTVAGLDCREHELELEQAKAQLAAAEAALNFSRFQYERVQKLIATKAVSVELVNERETEMLKSESEVSRQRALAEQSARRVGKCAIRAPFDAAVVERLASLGELLSPGTPVMQLLDIQHLEVRADVQEQDLAAIEAARALRFVSSSRWYDLRLRAVIPLVDSRLRTFEIRAEFVGEKAAPGEVGRVEWESSTLHLPAELLVRRGDEIGVFIVDDGRARFIALPEAQEGVATPAELAPDTKIVVDGRFGLDDGERVAAAPG